MLVPKKNRLAVYSYLFKEGVIVTKKDHTMTKHPQIEVPNLHVCKLMQSLRSREVVKEQFNWQYLYYTLTDKGIEYLREYLHVSEDTVPATLKKSTKVQPPPSFGGGRAEGADGRPTVVAVDPPSVEDAVDTVVPALRAVRRHPLVLLAADAVDLVVVPLAEDAVAPLPASKFIYSLSVHTRTGGQRRCARSRTETHSPQG